MIKEQKLLIERIKEAGPEAGSEIYEHYRPFIFRIIQKNRLCSLIWDYRENIIADVILDTLNFVLKTPTVWNLNGLIRHITKAKKSKTAREELSKRNKFPTQQLDDNLPDSRNNPEETMFVYEEQQEREIEERYLEICLETLTKVQRYVIKLRRQGKSWAEIARIRKVKQPAIHQIKTKAIERLKNCCDELRRIRKSDNTL
jgi:RNA polymerase sigma factor (sigma-70 family)